MQQKVVVSKPTQKQGSKNSGKLTIHCIPCNKQQLLNSKVLNVLPPAVRVKMTFRKLFKKSVIIDLLWVHTDDPSAHPTTNRIHLFAVLAPAAVLTLFGWHGWRCEIEGVGR
jgi:hypothetical protein